MLRVVLRFTTVLASLGVAASCTGPGTGNDVSPCLLEGPITEDRTLSPDECEEYAINEEVEVKAALVVEAGSVLSFGADTGFHVLEEGSLNAIGTADARIVLRGNAAGAGTWNGIAIRSNDGANALAFVDIDGAGGEVFCCDYFGINDTDAKAAIVLGPPEGARLALTDSVISDSGGDGLVVYPETALGAFARNAFAGITNAPVAVPLGQIGALDDETTYLDEDDAPGEPYVLVVNDLIEDDVTIKNIGASYAFEANVADATFEIDADVVIEAGVTLLFDATGGLQVSELGRIEAQGTTEEPVTFAGLDPGPGTWRGLAFRSLDNVLTEAIIDGAGGVTWCCDYEEEANVIVGPTLSSVTITGGAITNSAAFGVFTFGEGTAAVTGVDFSGNVTDQNLP